MPRMTTDDTATDWRGIAEQLTPSQIDDLARFEAFERGDEPAALLSIARELAAENLAAAVLSTVPAPAWGGGRERLATSSSSGWPVGGGCEPSIPASRGSMDGCYR
jgi:hypothetical protein